jgi:hypothetical protein
MAKAATGAGQRWQKLVPNLFESGMFIAILASLLAASLGDRE